MTDEFTGESAPVREAVAALIEADRAQILAAYMRGLEDIDSPLARETPARERAIAKGAQVLTQVVLSLRAGRVHLNEGHRLPAWDIEGGQAAHGLHAQESLAAMVFFQVTITFVARHLGADAMSLQLFMVVLLALHQSVNTRMGGATAVYVGYLLSKVHEAHVAERHRVARELHDGIGNVLSVAYRQLELYHLRHGEGFIPVSGPIETAQRYILESMEGLRAVTSELRLQKPVEYLEKAVANYLESAQVNGVAVRLRVNGDETWAPPAVRDESFFVIREAIRNALSHSSPTLVLVGVDVTADELRAYVEDDGCGFEYPQRSPSRHLGLLSMRERAILMGGNLTVFSKRHRGTRVELLVPLSGYRDDPTK